MARARFELNIKGLGEVLTRPAVVSYLEARGAAAVAAGGGALEAVTDVSPGGGRVPARAVVRVGYSTSMNPVHALRHEAKHGTLARALGAAGGG